MTEHFAYSQVPIDRSKSNDNAKSTRRILSTFLLVGFAGTLLAVPLVVGETEPTSQNCTKTTVAGKCGTDINLEPEACGTGEPTCYKTIWTFGNITNCDNSTSGLTTCEDGHCKKTIIKQKCEDGACVLDGEPVSQNIQQVSRAGGQACGGGGPGQMQPIDPQPFPGGGGG